MECSASTPPNQAMRELELKRDRYASPAADHPVGLWGCGAAPSLSTTQEAEEELRSDTSSSRRANEYVAGCTHPCQHGLLTGGSCTRLRALRAPLAHEVLPWGNFRLMLSPEGPLRCLRTLHRGLREEALPDCYVMKRDLGSCPGPSNPVLAPTYPLLGRGRMS